MQPRRLGVAQHEHRHDQDDKIHDHVPRLRGKHEPRRVEEALRARHLGRPLRGEGHATDHAQHDEDSVACAEQGDEDAAEAAVERHDADADVLEEDGQLEEQVAEGVDLGDGDADLRGRVGKLTPDGFLLRKEVG